MRLKGRLLDGHVSHGYILQRAWTIVPVVLNLQVQGDRGGSTTTSLAAGVFERIASGRSSQEVGV